MTQPTLLTGSVYAVEVPEGAFTWDNGKQYLAGDDDHGNMEIGTKPLPPGPWQLIGTVREVTNTQLAEIFGYAFIGDDHAMGTLSTLLASKGLDPGRNWVLVKTKQISGS